MWHSPKIYCPWTHYFLYKGCVKNVYILHVNTSIFCISYEGTANYSTRPKYLSIVYYTIPTCMSKDSELEEDTKIDVMNASQNIKFHYVRIDHIDNLSPCTNFQILLLKISQDILILYSFHILDLKTLWINSLKSLLFYRSLSNNPIF